MEANRSRAGIEGTGIRADDSLTQIAVLEPLICEIVLDEIGHGPFEQQRARFSVIAEPLFELLPRRRFADPDIVFVRRPECVTNPANQIRHSAPALHIRRREAGDFRIAALVVFVKLNTAAIFERDKQAVCCGRPAVAARRKIQLFDDERMQ